MHLFDRARRRRRATLLSLLLLPALLVAGCGGVDTVDEAEDGSSPAAEGAFPVEVLSGPVSGDDVITVEERPTSIISLSPTATEMLWEVGAGEQVVAVDDQSDYPAGVPTTKLSGYEPNVEAILDYEPDLVIAADDTGDLVANLSKARVPTLLLPAAADLEETYSQIERVGAAAGRQDEAAEVVDGLQQEVEEALAAAPDVEGTTYFHELSTDYFTASGDTFIGEVYGLFGLENVADRSRTGDLYPQLSDEYLVEADPDLVFLADSQCCGVKVRDVAERPGWQRMTAVAEDQVHVVDEDVASRWGPRVAEFIEQVSRILVEREQVAGAGG